MKKLGFGCMRLPLTDPNDNGSIDYEETSKMIDYFMANGYSYFDTAYVYHNKQSEIALRECLVKRYPRDSFTITTKLFLHELKSIEDAEKMFEEQLVKLGVDYIDYYWPHAISREKQDVVNGLNIFDFVLKKKAEGKVKHVGFSFHDTAEMLDDILTKHPEMEFVQLQLNYLDWNSPSVQAKQCYDVCVKHGKPVVVMEPVKGGVLANLPKEAEDNFKNYNPDVSCASWALRYAAGLDNVFMVLSGMSNYEQMVDNVKTFNNLSKLNEEEEEIIKKNVLIIQNKNRIPCTACRYCQAGCPMNIAIPDYFDLANNKKRKGKYTDLLNAGFGKASDCIKCGACETVCPQHLPIRDYLEDIIVKEYEED